MPASQKRSVRSRVEVTRMRPSGEKATDQVSGSCPASRRTSLPVAVSYSRTTFSFWPRRPASWSPAPARRTRACSSWALPTRGVVSPWPRPRGGPCYFRRGKRNVRAIRRESQVPHLFRRHFKRSVDFPGRRVRTEEFATEPRSPPCGRLMKWRRCSPSSGPPRAAAALFPS